MAFCVATCSKERELFWPDEVGPTKMVIVRWEDVVFKPLAVLEWFQKAGLPLDLRHFQIKETSRSFSGRTAALQPLLPQVFLGGPGVLKAGEMQHLWRNAPDTAYFIRAASHWVTEAVFFAGVAAAGTHPA